MEVVMLFHLSHTLVISSIYNHQSSRKPWNHHFGNKLDTTPSWGCCKSVPDIIATDFSFVIRGNIPLDIWTCTVIYIYNKNSHLQLEQCFQTAFEYSPNNVHLQARFELIISVMLFNLDKRTNTGHHMIVMECFKCQLTSLPLSECELIIQKKCFSNFFFTNLKATIRRNLDCIKIRSRLIPNKSGLSHSN